MPRAPRISHDAAACRASWPIEDSLLTRRIIEALFESATSGQWQDIPA
jgi:hypothetical protein